MTNDILKAQCETALQKQFNKRRKKLAYVIANRHRLKSTVKKADYISALLSLSRLTDREERLSDVQFDCLHFSISEGRVVSKVNVKKFIRRELWGIAG